MSDALSTADVLRKARALIEPYEKWVGRHNAFAPGCNCTSTAITDASPGEGRTAHMVFCEANSIDIDIDIGGGVFQAVYGWNDHPKRTHAEVLAAFDRAIELAEKQQ
jgi:hypothetical protein